MNHKHNDKPKVVSKQNRDPDIAFKLEQLFSQYETLCRYCDEVFATTYTALGAYMQCAKGCASCCVLETVTPLEAYCIGRFLQEHPLPALDEQDFDGACVFLHESICTIYPARPIICRTHGLPLLYPEREQTTNSELSIVNNELTIDHSQLTIAVCPLNFTNFDLDTLDPASFLDAERITANLMRLNLAFCLLTGQPDRADERIPLRTSIQNVSAA